MIAVTCRNGEHFSVDPLHIERVETDPDTVIHLVDGTKYVVDQPFDDLLQRHLRPPGDRAGRADSSSPAASPRSPTAPAMPSSDGPAAGTATPGAPRPRSRTTTRTDR